MGLDPGRPYGAVEHGDSRQPAQIAEQQNNGRPLQGRKSRTLTAPLLPEQGQKHASNCRSGQRGRDGLLEYVIDQ